MLHTVSTGKLEYNKAHTSLYRFFFTVFRLPALLIKASRAKSSTLSGSLRDFCTFAFHNLATRYMSSGMRNYALIGLVAVFAGSTSAACNLALKIDDFSTWSSNTNSLGSWTSGMYMAIL